MREIKELFAATNLLGDKSLADIERETSRMIWIGIFFSTTTCLSLTKEIRKGRSTTPIISNHNRQVYTNRLVCLRWCIGTIKRGLLLKKKRRPQKRIKATLIRIPCAEKDIQLSQDKLNQSLLFYICHMLCIKCIFFLFNNLFLFFSFGFLYHDINGILLFIIDLKFFLSIKKIISDKLRKIRQKSQFWNVKKCYNNEDNDNDDSQK